MQLGSSAMGTRIQETRNLSTTKQQTGHSKAVYFFKPNAIEEKSEKNQIRADYCTKVLVTVTKLNTSHNSPIYNECRTQ